MNELEKYLISKYDPEIDQAQDRANQRRLMAGLGGSAAKLGAAIAGTGQPVDTSFYQRMAEQSDRPVEQIQQRKKLVADYLNKKREQELELAKLDSDKAYKDKQLALQEEGNRLREQKNKIDQGIKEREVAVKERTAETKTEKLSPTQQKKLGLPKIGIKAEEQFRAAMNKGIKSGEYDPTDPTQFIDSSKYAPNWMKSDAAVELRAAADSWIDSFLRDESGAAIPKDERSEYYAIYFPQGGDSPEVVANKESLRMEKMNNALIAGNQEALAADYFNPTSQKPDRATAYADSPGTGQIQRDLSGQRKPRAVDLGPPQAKRYNKDKTKVQYMIEGKWQTFDVKDDPYANFYK